jgi:hypothetical protein
MAIPVHTTFVDSVTAVVAAWLNRMQEMNIGLIRVKSISITTTNFVLACGAGQDACVININGQMRTAEANKTLSFSGSDSPGTYGIFAQIASSDVDPAFSLTKVADPGVPSVTHYRKLATVYWDGSSLSSLVTEPGIGQTSHASQHAPGGSDPLVAGSISGANLSTDAMLAATRVFL